MQHPDEGTIHAWLDGALSGNEAAEVEAHVAGCAQCAAAVAEARGFIAGASRILTALDSVPSGVVPVPRIQQRTNWSVWRAAAAIVVVAVGSFVVLKDRIRGSETVASDSVSVTATAAMEQSRRISSPELAQPEVRPQVLRSAPPRVAAAAAAPPVQSNSATAQQRRNAADLREGAPSSSGVRQESPSASSLRASSPSSAVVGAAKRAERAEFSAAGSTLGSVVAMDAASDTPPPRIVGNPRELGRRSTLYEVSPGDTVVLSEALETRLDEVVVTGVQSVVTTQAVGAARATRSAAADTQAVAPAKKSAVQPAVAPAPASAPPATRDIAHFLNTIAWTDTASGKRMTLSGHHSTVELQEIRERIERSRASRAAEKKKEP